jgi:hypothetical protein
VKAFLHYHHNRLPLLAIRRGGKFANYASAVSDDFLAGTTGVSRTVQNSTAVLRSDPGKILVGRSLRTQVVTMMDPSPELDQSIQKLKKLSHHLSSNSPKVLAEVYLASIALLVNLKVDQATLQKTR